MSIAASLWFDEALEGRVRELWSEIARHGISDHLHRGPYRPHVTMGVWDGIDAPRLASELKHALASEPAPEIRFEAIGTFPGEPAVVYVVPGITDALWRLRERTCEIATQLGGRSAPWLPSGPWFPHCTLAWRIAPVQALQAIALVQSASFPLAGRAAAVGIVETPAEVELARVPFGTR